MRPQKGRQDMRSVPVDLALSDCLSSSTRATPEIVRCVLRWWRIWCRLCLFNKGCWSIRDSSPDLEL